MQGIIGRNYPGKPLQGHGMGQKAGCKINTLKHKGGFWLLRDPLSSASHPGAAQNARKLPGGRLSYLFILSYIILYYILYNIELSVYFILCFRKIEL